MFRPTIDATVNNSSNNKSAFGCINRHNLFPCRLFSITWPKFRRQFGKRSGRPNKGETRLVQRKMRFARDGRRGSNGISNKRTCKLDVVRSSAHHLREKSIVSLSTDRKQSNVRGEVTESTHLPRFSRRLIEFESSIKDDLNWRLSVKTSQFTCIHCDPVKIL
jgi:hypothetical protein